SIPALAAGVALAAVVAAGLWFATTSRGGMEAAATPAADVIRVDAAVVTNTEYKAFCDATGHPYPDPPADNPNYFYANPDEPALNITYPDAVAFSAWAGKRLPTAQEWDSGAWQNTLTPRIAEWTSTRFTPSEADLAAIRKLAGSEPQGDWYVIKGNPALPALPSNAQIGRAHV